MQRVVVLGGGVGGTLAANLIARKLKREISAGKARVTVVDATGSHAYQPGYMYIAMGSEKPEKLVRNSGLGTPLSNDAASSRTSTAIKVPSPA